MDNSHIYCDNCASIQPMIVEPPSGDDVSGRFTDSSDILCGTCKLVLATTYKPKASSADALRRVMQND
jgi:hypothetical protein